MVIKVNIHIISLLIKHFSQFFEVPAVVSEIHMILEALNAIPKFANILTKIIKKHVVVMSRPEPSKNLSLLYY